MPAMRALALLAAAALLVTGVAGQACTDIDPNCSQCDGSFTTCEACDQSAVAYVLLDNVCVDPLACTVAVASCTTCDAADPNVCAGCDQSTDPAFTLFEGQCVSNNQCIVNDANCATCDAAAPGFCSACVATHTLVNGFCELCTVANCATCVAGDVATCDVCFVDAVKVDGVGCVLNTQCLVDVANCGGCDAGNPALCSACAAGFTLDAAAQVCNQDTPSDEPCLQDAALGCATCSTADSSRCATCLNPGFVVDATTGACRAKTCQENFPNCRSCNANGACIRCKYGRRCSTGVRPHNHGYRNRGHSHSGHRYNQNRPTQQQWANWQYQKQAQRKRYQTWQASQRKRYQRQEAQEQAQARRQSYRRSSQRRNAYGRRG